MYTVGGVKMQLPLIIGAGVCKTPASVLPYMRPDVSHGAIITGSYTFEARDPNKGNLFWPENIEEFRKSGFGLNSFGMPNMGFAAASLAFKRSYLYPLIMSVAGFSVRDYAHGARVSDLHRGVSATDLNLGCPNAHDMKTIPISYDPESLAAILETIAHLRLHKPIWVKLSPYITEEKRAELASAYPQLDFSNVPVVGADYLSEVLALLRARSFVKAISFNTLPNVIFRNENGEPVTTPNGGKAGLSGPILKSVYLDLVRETVCMLGGDIDVIGSGVLSGEDAVEFFQAGAKAIACTSGPFWSGDGPRFFTNLISESEELQEYLVSTEPADTATN